MDKSTDRDSLREDTSDSTAILADGWVASLSDSLSGMAPSLAGFLTNLNLVASFSLLAALASFWIDFRGGYAATKIALSPVAAGLLPSVLVGVTAFVVVWCVVNSWRYIPKLKARVAPDLKTKADLKKLAPDVELCLFFLEEVRQAEGKRRDVAMGYVRELGLSLWEDLQSIGLDGPTAYSILFALPDHPNDEVNVEQLSRVLNLLAPLAHRGDVKEARRLY